MKIGAAFNPYRVFQGVFAPFWILEHRRIGTGAKLCYIRLLGFAGKDARCYPSLTTLGASLGVSERQARDYVKELERAGLIAAEQRGLRKTNVYLFLWTAELEQQSNLVPCGGQDDQGDISGESLRCPVPDRNNGSGLDRKASSGPDRKNSAGLDRNKASGPIGINSEGNTSQESSSTSEGRDGERTTSTTSETPDHNGESEDDENALSRAAQTISDWAGERAIQRLRGDRRIGPPEKELLTQWAAICGKRGIDDQCDIYAVMDAARVAADRSGEWRRWTFLTIQVQLAAEKVDGGMSLHSGGHVPLAEPPEEDPSCDWAKAKMSIRTQIPEISFENWFDRTRQIDRRGTEITVAVPDEPTRTFLESEYAGLTKCVVSSFGVDEVRFIVGYATANQTSDSAMARPAVRDT